MVRIVHDTTKRWVSLGLAEVQLFDSLGGQLPRLSLAFAMTSSYNAENTAAVGTHRSCSTPAARECMSVLAGPPLPVDQR
jgi:hypothetical protein